MSASGGFLFLFACVFSGVLGFMFVLKKERGSNGTNRLRFSRELYFISVQQSKVSKPLTPKICSIQQKENMGGLKALAT